MIGKMQYLAIILGLTFAFVVNATESNCSQMFPEDRPNAAQLAELDSLQTYLRWAKQVSIKAIDAGQITHDREAADQIRASLRMLETLNVSLPVDLLAEIRAIEQKLDGGRAIQPAPLAPLSFEISDETQTPPSAPISAVSGISPIHSAADTSLEVQPGLEALLAEAEILKSQGVKDVDLAQELRILANVGFDLRNPSTLAMRAFALARELDPGGQKKWDIVDLRFENPIEIYLGQLDHPGVIDVRAQVVFRDLKLNGSVRERSEGILFIVKIDLTDERINKLKKVTAYDELSFETGKVAAKRRRRWELRRDLEPWLEKNPLADDEIAFVVATTRLGMPSRDKSKPSTSDLMLRGKIDPWVVSELMDLFNDVITNRRRVHFVGSVRGGETRRSP